MMLARTASLLLLTSSAFTTFAQQPVTAPQPANAALTLNVVVSAGERGDPVSGLNQGSFTVLDNGAAQPIQSFRAVTGKADPVKVLLVIDAVNINYERLAYARQQIERFLRANDGRLSSPTALAIFTDRGTQIQGGYSTDGNGLADLLNKQVIGLRDLRRSAGFYGAEERLDLSLKTMNELVSRAAGERGRKFIVWISPGWPLLSGPEIQYSSKEQQRLFEQVQKTSTALRRANVTVYTIDPLGAGEGPGRTFYFEDFLKGVTKPSQAVPGDLGLQVLSVQSGGRFLGSNNDLGVLLHQCFVDADAWYEITYKEPPSDGPVQYHRIQVRVADPHLVARTRQGYYAEPGS